MHSHKDHCYLSAPEVVSISLGANMGNPARKLRETINELNRLDTTKVLSVSGLYHTVPVGPVAQPPFINAALLLKTRLRPFSLLAELKAIERSSGRKKREQSWGPRILDLDIITYGKEVITGRNLEIPHTEVHKRCFVLQPLDEIAADLHIPTKGKVRDLASHCKKHDVRRIGPTKPLATRKKNRDLRTIRRRKAIATRMRFIFNMNQKTRNV